MPATRQPTNVTLPKALIAQARDVVDLQSDFLAELTSRVVAPLFPADKLAGPANQLNPLVEIEGKEFVLFTQLLAKLPKSDLKRPIASIADKHDEISRALDLRFTGF